MIQLCSSVHHKHPPYTWVEKSNHEIGRITQWIEQQEGFVWCSVYRVGFESCQGLIIEHVSRLNCSRKGLLGLKSPPSLARPLRLVLLIRSTKMLVKQPLGLNAFEPRTKTTFSRWPVGSHTEFAGAYTQNEAYCRRFFFFFFGGRPEEELGILLRLDHGLPFPSVEVVVPQQAGRVARSQLNDKVFFCPLHLHSRESNQQPP